MIQGHMRRVGRPRHLMADARAGIAVLMAVLFPVLIGVGLLIVDTPRLFTMKLLVQHVTQAAALAGGNKLTTYYTSGTGSTTAIVASAQQFATLNAPVASYGTIVQASNVVVGNWNPTTSTFTSLTSSGGTTPNAVQVTGLATAANHNAILTFLGNMVNASSMDVTSVAIASYGTGSTFNTIVINDLSQSFRSEITEQRSADLAILNCVARSAGPNSQFGITTIDGHSSIFQALTTASTNLSALQTRINALNYCGTTGMPACSGSNVAAGIYSAIQQFSGSAYANAKNNIVIITDGVPNASSGVTYGRTDGTYVPAGATSGICTTRCTDANLLTMATDQAAIAIAAGISISTIYYSGDTSSGDESTYETELRALTGGTGVAMVAPSTTTITTAYGGFCSTMSSILKVAL